MEMRLDRLLGRHVYDRAGRRVGRLEEFRARKEGQGWVIDEYVIGAAGLLERLDLGVRLVLGFKPRGYIATWDQVVLDDTPPIRLTCPVDQLRRV
jgi:hypothetical protein